MPRATKSTPKLTHLDAQGQASMVDVSDKPETVREARAQAVIRMSAEAFEAMQRGDAKKGDVLGVARIAGIQAAKRTSELIPLCHPLPLSKVGVTFTVDVKMNSVRVLAEVKTRGPTGVEMEALVAANVAALTIYDMLKAVDRTMEVHDVFVVEKTGGQRGDYARKR
jgi:cyclic pyranopterin phosphate synthase